MCRCIRHHRKLQNMKVSAITYQAPESLLLNALEMVEDIRDYLPDGSGFESLRSIISQKV